MARSATGVVRVVAISLLIWHSVIARTTPAVAYGRGFPSLSKEGSSACRVSRQKLDSWLVSCFPSWQSEESQARTISAQLGLAI